MPELRQDPVLGHWVILSEERGRRPLPPAPEASAAPDSSCAFCPGHEDETLPEIAGVRAGSSPPDTPGWRVRVVPNKFPALRPDAALASEESGLFTRRAGTGHHEVIIEGEEHTRSVTALTPDRMREVVGVYRDRFRALAREPGLRSAVLIKNVGDAAGMSIEHSHSQLIATPVASPVLAAELRAARSWADGHAGECIWCAIVGAERARAQRVVATRGGLVALCPWASRFPFETWILPIDHESHFESTSDAVLEQLAGLLPEVLRAIEQRLAHPPYNYAIHSAPFPSEPTPGYHWRLAILPRVTRVAGYEQASGVFINHLPPERAAAELRETLGAA